MTFHSCGTIFALFHAQQKIPPWQAQQGLGAEETMRHSKGFTMLELMVVVAIIGIITAIAIPYYNNYKKTACDQAAIADLYNVKAAVQKYLTDATLKGTSVATDIAGAVKAVLADTTGQYGYPGPTKKCGVTLTASGSIVTVKASAGTDQGATGWSLDMAGGQEPIALASGGSEPSEPPIRPKPITPKPIDPGIEPPAVPGPVRPPQVTLPVEPGRLN